MSTFCNGKAHATVAVTLLSHETDAAIYIVGLQSKGMGHFKLKNEAADILQGEPTSLTFRGNDTCT